MQIATARKNAQKYVEDNLLESLARRPDKDARVMVRYPRRSGSLILAGDKDQLVEKVAKKMQATARKAAH